MAIEIVKNTQILKWVYRKPGMEWNIKYSMEYGKHGMEYKIKYSLIGVGYIRISPEYKHVFVDPVHFSKLTSNQK